MEHVLQLENPMFPLLIKCNKCLLTTSLLSHSVTVQGQIITV
jgi:hypothetical protein